MRFLQTESRELKQLTDSEVRELKPGYAILSHRWRKGQEVLFEDISSDNRSITTIAGYSKLCGACDLARKFGYDYVWIDTCCIKSVDSSELTEAINSMYTWYHEAAVCIVYLQDVHQRRLSTDAEFSKSDWFNRGWTLQKLIAPKKVEFFDCEWNYLGNKSTLASKILASTGIPSEVLDNSRLPQSYSIAQRMSWAAKRRTERIEDRAYSLMGLFSVNMPLIYGERERAFLRLQEQIITRSTDESIFIWDLDILDDSVRDPRHVYTGLLAPSPACFEKYGDVIYTGSSQGFHVDQFGFSATFQANPYSINTFLALPNARHATRTDALGIVLIKLGDTGFFARTGSDDGDSILHRAKVDATPRKFIIPVGTITPPERMYHGFWLREVYGDKSDVDDVKILHRADSSESNRIAMAYSNGVAGVIRLTLAEFAKTKEPHFAWIWLALDRQKPKCLVTVSLCSNRNERTLRHYSHLMELLSRDACDYQTRLEHEIFDDFWTYYEESPSRFPSCVALLKAGRYAGYPDNIAEMGFHLEAHELSVQAQLVPDTSPIGWPQGKVWAIDIRIDGSEEQPTVDAPRSRSKSWLQNTVAGLSVHKLRSSKRPAP